MQLGETQKYHIPFYVPVTNLRIGKMVSHECVVVLPVKVERKEIAIYCMYLILVFFFSTAINCVVCALWLLSSEVFAVV